MEEKLWPDYRLSVEQVFTGIAAYFVMNKDRLLDVLNLATCTPKMPSLPTWVPNWANLPASLRDKRVRTPLSDQDMSSNNTNSYQKFDYEMVSYEEAKVYGYRLDPQISATGRLSIPGICLPYRLSTGRTEVRFSLRTPHREPREQQGLVTVLLLDYSTALLVEPSNTSSEFDLIGAGKFAIQVRGHDIDFYGSTDGGLNASCLIPPTKSELAFIDECIARPEELPSFSGSQFPFVQPLEAYNTTTQSARLSKNLLSFGFAYLHDEEIRLWEMWKQMEAKTMSRLSWTDMQSIYNDLDLIKSLNGWDEFRGDPMTTYLTSQCRIASFLSLFILDPRTPITSVTSNLGFPFMSINDASGTKDSVPESLRDWGEVTIRLLWLVSGKMVNDDWRIKKAAEFIKECHPPGSDLFNEARGIWHFHSSVARTVCESRPSWKGWYAWFMLRKIERQRYEGKDIGWDRILEYCCQTKRTGTGMK